MFKESRNYKNLKKPYIVSIADKKVIWLPGINKYIVISSPTEKIIEELYNGKTDKQLENFCTNTLGLNLDESKQIISRLRNELDELLATNSLNKTESIHQKNQLGVFNCKRYYNINGLVFLMEYETAEIEYLIHPKFAHLEAGHADKINHHFQIYTDKSKFVLKIDKLFVGNWSVENVHFMTGKVSMEILRRINKNKEEDWMAVFHASGISNGNEGIVFLGDSGSGKSTLSAILMASGYYVLADDFLPVESETLKLCNFPAAISVKTNAIDLLAVKFPELKSAKEYRYAELNKTVRYLSQPESEIGKIKKVPCKALVFVKYKENSGIDFNSLPKDIAFRKLVPDSWISPQEKNAIRFLNWYRDLPCYQIVYSDNDSMVEVVRKIFEDKI